jgi:hypothetical protein
MNVIVLELKKELRKKSNDISNLSKELGQKNRQLADFKSNIEAQSRKIKILDENNQVPVLTVDSTTLNKMGTQHKH